MKNKIQSLKIITQQGIKVYQVTDAEYYFPDIISTIEDCSKEYENSYIPIYEVKDKKGNMIARIVNCPTEVQYFKEPLTEQETKDLPF